MSFRFNPFRKIKKVLHKHSTPEKDIAESILGTDIEKRESSIRNILRSPDGIEKLRSLLEHFREEKKKIENNLENINNFYITQTLIHIYNFDPESAAKWTSLTDSKQRLADKLPDLPEVIFEDNTSQSDIENLKNTFKAQVKQVDTLNRLIPQIEHVIMLILKVAPTLDNDNQEQTQHTSTASPC